MDLEEDTVRSRVCLCVLCGLPAAGKSSVAGQVSTLCCAEQQRLSCSVVHYDDLIPLEAFRVLEDGNHGDMQTEWKMYRQAVLQCIEQFLENPQVLAAEPPASCPLNRDAWRRCIQTALASPGTGVGTSQTQPSPLVLLLDDNFYYPSMRYEVYQLARKHSLGFCQVYLHCPVETCISRNQSRSTPLPREVILEMEERMVSPNPQKNSWEKNSIVLDTTDSLTKGDIQELMEFILFALNNPLSPVEDHTEQKEADRLKCATSVIHQADQACRRLVSEAMKSARDNKVPPESLRSLATELNESKTRFLHTMRKQFLEDLVATQEEIDVDLVVKRAVQVFDHDKNEILYRFLQK